MRSVRAAGFVVVAALCAACSTQKYSHARETRSERTYLGGAAAVPDEPPAAAAPSAFDLFAWLGAIALGWTHGVDATAPSNQPYPPDTASRPQR